LRNDVQAKGNKLYIPKLHLSGVRSAPERKNEQELEDEVDNSQSEALKVHVG